MPAIVLAVRADHVHIARDWLRTVSQQISWRRSRNILCLDQAAGQPIRRISSGKEATAIFHRWSSELEELERYIITRKATSSRSQTRYARTLRDK